MGSSFSQQTYQVRFEWGVEGADAVARDADVVVVVDVLTFTTRVDLALASGSAAPDPGPDTAAGALVARLADHRGTVVAGSLRNAKAVAAWFLAQQDSRGERLSIAVIGAGDRRPDGSTRFAVEDLLGAGSIIEELAQLGIDANSPEAATAAAAFVGLRNATGHLLSASGSGRELSDAGSRDDVTLASKRNVSDLVPVLREFTFTA